MFLLLLLLSANISYSQEEIQFTQPNYEEIEKNIKDKDSKFYYNELERRLNNFDTTLNIIDMEHLYYGTVFSNSYNAYVSSDLKDKLYSILNQEDHTDEIFNEIIDLCKKILLEEKFNFDIYNYLQYAYSKLEDKENLEKSYKMVLLIYSTIVKSGDGSSCESAMHVVYVYNEYNILKTLGLKNESQALSGKCDILTLEKNEIGIEELYFNVEKCLNSFNFKD